MLDPSRAWRAWFDLSIQGMRLGWEAQNVIALRLMRLGLGHTRARSEIQRMVREKFAALAEAQGAAAAATLMGASSHRVVKKTLSVYRKRVRSSKRRLTRRG